jgi:hypothetical protein
MTADQFEKLTVAEMRTYLRQECPDQMVGKSRATKAECVDLFKEHLNHIAVHAALQKARWDGHMDHGATDPDVTAVPAGQPLESSPEEATLARTPVPAPVVRQAQDQISKVLAELPPTVAQKLRWFASSAQHPPANRHERRKRQAIRDQLERLMRRRGTTLQAFLLDPGL